MRFRNRLIALTLASIPTFACNDPVEFKPIPLVLKAHVAGLVTNVNGQPQQGLTVALRCPSNLNSGLPQSSRLSDSRESDAMGAYDTWLGIDHSAVGTNSSTALDATCAVMVLKGVQPYSVAPDSVVVHFVSASGPIPITSLNLAAIPR